MKIVVLGAGLVGGPMALDLAQDNDLHVTVVDKQLAALEKVKARNPRVTKEKTLRYPGHIEKMALLRDTGFFDTEPVDSGIHRDYQLKAVASSGRCGLG